MAKRTGTDPDGRATVATDEARPFRRMLVATDESQAARAAAALVAEWVEGSGADARFVHVAEDRRQGRDDVAGAVAPVPAQPAHRLVVRASSLGARNRQLVQGIAAAAGDFDADVIVLGFDRQRLAGHRLAPSLREQIMRATDLPVLVAPSPSPDGTGHHPSVPDLRHDEERARTAGRFAHV